MRVAMLGWEFPPFVSGGLGVHCFELTRALCKKGLEIDFFMPVSGKEIIPPCKGIRVIEVAKTNLVPYLSFSKTGQIKGYEENLISAVNEYWQHCKQAVLLNASERPYDLIHAHDWLACQPAVKLKEMLGMPYVQTFHSTEFDRTSWPWDYILGIERMAAKNADLIIAVSKRTADMVLRLGAEQGKIRIVYNGVDFAKFAFAEADAKAISRFKRGKKVVLFLGRLTEQKGPVQFLHAAKEVLAAQPDTIFAIAGKGELLPLLVSMSISLGISQNVRFLGYLPEEEQRRIYKIADAYVMPSTSEPFGITALEAMSSGVPVIISKTSGVSEIVKSAIKVDFWDIHAMAQKIIAVLRYPPLAKTLSQMALPEAQRQSWEKAAEETIKVYQEAISLCKKG
jgi:glycosyltransferase involved in cell wall biosynthesis